LRHYPSIFRFDWVGGRPLFAILEGCNILLAEDGPDNQNLISFVLKKARAKVTIAENGRLAVDSALDALNAGTPFHVILMEIRYDNLL
jgi:CheY-like chemotaxis protein